MIQQIVIKVLASSGILGSCTTIFGVYIWKPELLKQKRDAPVIYAFSTAIDAENQPKHQYVDKKIVCKLKTNITDDSCIVEKAFLNKANKLTSIYYLKKQQFNSTKSGLVNADFRTENRIFKIAVTDVFFDSINWSNNNLLNLFNTKKDGSIDDSAKFGALVPFIGVKDEKNYFNSSQYLLGQASMKKTLKMTDKTNLSCSYYNESKFEDYLDCEILEISDQTDLNSSNSKIVWNQKLDSKPSEIKSNSFYLIKFNDLKNKINTDTNKNTSLLLFEGKGGRKDWQDVGSFINLFKVLPYPISSSQPSNLIIF